LFSPDARSPATERSVLKVHERDIDVEYVEDAELQDLPLMIDIP
jgi:hypothetical protein